MMSYPFNCQESLQYNTPLGQQGSSTPAVSELQPASPQARHQFLQDLSGGVPLVDLARRVPDGITRCGILDKDVTKERIQLLAWL